MGDRRRGRGGQASSLRALAEEWADKQPRGAAHGAAGAADPGALAAGARESSRLEPAARRYPAGAPCDRGEGAGRHRALGASAGGACASLRRGARRLRAGRGRGPARIELVPTRRAS
jgi:hypothetical protein